MNTKENKNIDPLMASLKTEEYTHNILDSMKDMETFDSKLAFAELTERLNKDDLLNTKKSFHTLPWSIATAAAICIGIIIGTFIVQKPQDISFTNNNNTPQVVSLPDGSVIHLNKNAIIRYSKGFNSTHRKLALEGEAFFDISKNKDLPLIINTNQAVITVVGTSFNIKPTEKRFETEILVSSGIVKIAHEDQLEESILLEASELGSVQRGRVSKANNKADINYLSWKTKEFIFEDESIMVVLNDIRRAYHTNIQIKSSEIENKRITATYNGLTVDELMKSIELTLGLSVTKSSDNHFVISN